METKLQKLKIAALDGNWRKAISIASRFQKLGDIRGAVLDAHMAYTNPRFLKQIGKDVDACLEAGKSALINAYSIKN